MALVLEPNETARDMEKAMGVDGVAHEFMKAGLLSEYTLKNTDISGEPLADPRTISMPMSMHHIITALQVVTAVIILVAWFLLLGIPNVK